MEWEHLENKTVIVQKKQYQIQKFLGQGSHATVWSARARFYPHDEITIKISKEKSGIPYERLENEIWFLKEIEHPNIPKLLDYSELNGYIWLAMPIFQPLQINYPAKGKLKKVLVSDIRREGYPKHSKHIPLKYREKSAIEVLRDISKAISYLSGTGIVHADISPGNIMEKKGSLVQKEYVLTDWGATALIHRYPEESFGSLHFTAPERLWGQVGYKSDLFSLGVTCFYILTGEIPYWGENGETYYLNVVERDGTAPSDFLSRVNPSLDKLIRSLIRQRPENRPEPQEVCKKIEKLKASF